MIDLVKWNQPWHKGQNKSDEFWLSRFTSVLSGFMPNVFKIESKCIFADNKK